MGFVKGSINKLFEEYSRVPVKGFVETLLKKITALHRIQGSKGLLEAIELVAHELEGLGLDVKTFDVPSSSVKGFMETPVSWDVESGYLRINKGSSALFSYDYQDHPTLVAAHSPPGEGCSDMKYCTEAENCSGDAVLLEAPAFAAYELVDANLVILFDSKRYPEAVPYSGLFIKSQEVKKKPVVVNIPYTAAQTLISLLNKGASITVCWSVRTRYHERPLKGLVAYAGGDPGALFISHICHPKPGAHDNASGVAANTAVAKILSEASTRYSHAHLFVPEYSGTIYAKEHLPWNPVSVIDLDMVGSRQNITGSVLNVVNPPLFMKPVSAASTYIAIKVAFDTTSSFGGFSLPSIRYSQTPYTAGSDHDVTLAWGLDSAMLNEWPSKYYHTDMDDIDSLSIASIAKTAVAAATAGYLALSVELKNRIVAHYKDYLASWYAIEAMKKGIDVSALGKVFEYWGKEVVINVLETPVSSRFLYKSLGYSKYMKLRNIKGAHTYLSLYAPLAYINGLKDFEELYQLENLLHWSEEEKGIIREAWLTIKSSI